MEKAASSRCTALAIQLAIVLGIAISTSGCGGGDGGSSAGLPDGPSVPEAPVTLTPPPVFRSFQAVDAVLGQPDFTSKEENRGEDPAAASLAYAHGVAATPDGGLLVADTGNRRLLGFGDLTERFGQAARFVLGQDGFGERAEGGVQGYSEPRSISVGAGKVAVADPRRHRVLIYDAVPVDGTAVPSVIIGQQGFEDSDQTCDGVHLSFPLAVHITPDGKLVVADTDHSRVLIWDRIPEAGQHGVAATAVLGQESLTDCVIPFPPDRNTIVQPKGLWSDGTRLAVSDDFSNRVLLWDALTMENGQEPVRVLGQIDLDTIEERPAAADTLHSPSGIASDGTRLAVADSGNHRVLIWNSWPSRDGQSAEVVLGQRDFAGSGANAGRGTATASAEGLQTPDGMAFHRGNLVVTDTGHNRIVVFRPN